MSFVEKPPLRPAALSLCLLCALPSAAQEAVRAREILNAMSPLTSPDGAFRVGASSEVIKPHRFAVLSLCRSLRQRLAAYAPNAATLEGGVIYVALGAGGREGTGITVTRPADHISHYIEVADPETVDAAALEALLAQCLLNNWLAAARRNAGAAPRGEVPLWFALGLANYADSTRHEACFERVEELMMAGRLPPLAELLEDGGNAPEISTLLVAWLMETSLAQADLARKAKGTAAPELLQWFSDAAGRHGYARLHDTLAMGAAWPGASLPEEMAGLGPPAARESWDLWLQKCRAKIFNAGTAGPGVWARLRQMLYAYPVDTAMATGDVQRGKTFSELAEMPPHPWRRRAAEQRVMALRTSAVGRDNTYKEVVEAYCGFLDALQKNEPPESLRARLAIAEARYLAAYAEVMSLNKGVDNERRPPVP